MDCILVWSGSGWQRRPALPDEPWFADFPSSPGLRFLPDSSVKEPTAEELERATKAMVVNPLATTVLAPQVLEFTYNSYFPMNELIKSGLENPQFSSVPELETVYEYTLRTYQRSWLISPTCGQANYLQSWIWTRLSGPWLTTLYHELWHTVSRWITPAENEALWPYEDAIRKANEKADIWTAKCQTWLDRPDEPAAWAFECYATGQPLPYEIEMPKAVRKTFDRALAGQITHRSGNFVNRKKPIPEAE